MVTGDKKSGERKEKSTEYSKQIQDISKKISEKQSELEKKTKKKCYLFLGNEITGDVVNEVFDNLRKNYCDCNGKLDVIVDSGGGNIDAAYNLANLFQKYGHKELYFIIPRWAKSAATLLVCGGDKILMTPIAELGPIDPQITAMNTLEKRMEQFSPLHIESTLNLIREEYKKGHKDLADKLIERLQFPLTLGSFLKSLEVGEQYLDKILARRMLKDSSKTRTSIAKSLTQDYADHSACINFDEAKSLGLIVEQLDEDMLNIVWNLYSLYRKKKNIENRKKQDEMIQKIKELPPHMIEKITPELKELEENNRGGLNDN